MKLSVVLSVFNEEKKLARTLGSLSFADEIIIVDNGSTDNTVAISKQYNAKIYQKVNNLMLNLNKNFGFSKASGDWILNLDADEVVENNLKKEIDNVISKDEAEGFLIPRKNIIFNKWIKHSLWWPDYQLRLFKNGRGKFPCKHVHEMLSVDGRVLKLNNPLTHYNYESISQFIYKLDKIYSDNEAVHFIQSGKSLHWLDLIRMPFADFIKTFFAQKGYLDGIHGLILSLLQAFYQIIVFAKIWEKKNFLVDEPNNLLKEFFGELGRMLKEFRYWKRTSQYEETVSPTQKLFLRIMRKLGL